MMKPVLSLLVPSLLLLAACGGSEEPEVAATPAPEVTETPAEIAGESEAAMISDGRAIVEQNCAGCHAIGSDDDSPRLEAPPLRFVLEELDREALSADFREGIHVGAVDMPDFDFGPLGTEAVFDYISSIQVSIPADAD